MTGVRGLTTFASVIRANSGDENNFGGEMSRLRILPGAAGIIALTAAMGFVDGRFDVEAESFTRGRIALMNVTENVDAADELSRNSSETKSDRLVYLVDIRRSQGRSEVSIDAATGKVLFIKPVA
jgi:hypothetical protein